LKSKKLTLICSIGLILVLATSMLFSACAKEEAPAPAPAVEVFPARPIEIIVPWSAGGGTDRVCRALAGTWGAYSDVALRIIPMPGGGGADAHRFVAEAEPDGYTLCATAFVLIGGPLFRDLGFVLEDFDPLFNIAGYAMIVAVPEDSPFNTLQEFFDYVKDHPGELSYGTSGVGGDSHVGSEVLLSKGGDLKMKHVPLEGGAEQVAMLLGGHIDMALLTYATGLPSIKSGALKALAVTDVERHKEMDAPTCRELGIDWDFVMFRAMLAPTGVPPERMDVLREAFRQVMEDEGFLGLLKKLGETPRYKDSDKLKVDLFKMREDLVPVAEVIKAGM